MSFNVKAQEAKQRSYVAEMIKQTGQCHESRSALIIPASRVFQLIEAVLAILGIKKGVVFEALIAHDDLSECWEAKSFGSHHKKDGYVSIGVPKAMSDFLDRKRMNFHRLVFITLYCQMTGLKPSDLDDWQADHICRNRKCFNPSHIGLATYRENISRAQVDHCRKCGSEFAGENLYIWVDKKKSVHRHCMNCRKGDPLGLRTTFQLAA